MITILCIDIGTYLLVYHYRHVYFIMYIYVLTVNTIVFVIAFFNGIFTDFRIKQDCTLKIPGTFGFLWLGTNEAPFRVPRGIF